jgi:hypothetical protein
MRYSCAFTLLVSLCALAQTPAPETAPAPAQLPDTFSFKRLQFSGYVDSFYDLNYNHPPSRLSQLQAFNFTADKWSLASATASISTAPAPVGFRVDVGMGRVYDAFWLSETSHDGWTRHLLNAYVSVKPASWKGVQLDFGKFVTSAGAELTESHLNWNYSRSLLFAFGPYYHTGLRATVPVGERWTVGGAVVTGWNTVRDNNTGKTVGFTSTGNFGKISISNTYYAGPENTGVNRGWRNFYDSVVSVNPSSRVSMYFNFDIGNNRFPAAPSSTFWGTAGAARIRLSRNFALAPRLEYYSDRDGFWTGSPNAFREFTLTAESKLNDNLISRIEFRKDWSREPFFTRGPSAWMANHQTMLVAGVMIVLNPRLLDFTPGSGK